MSDRIRFSVGTVMIIGCILFCTVPVVIKQHAIGQRYQSGYRQQYIIPAIEPESDGMIRINTADADVLKELPGIGDTLASLIIEERNRNGSFFYAEDLESVKGIGFSTLNRFRHMIVISPGESEE